MTKLKFYYSTEQILYDTTLKDWTQELYYTQKTLNDRNIATKYKNDAKAIDRMLL